MKYTHRMKTCPPVPCPPARHLNVTSVFIRRPSAGQGMLGQHGLCSSSGSSTGSQKSNCTDSRPAPRPAGVLQAAGPCHAGAWHPTTQTVRGARQGPLQCLHGTAASPQRPWASVPGSPQQAVPSDQSSRARGGRRTPARSHFDLWYRNAFLWSNLIISTKDKDASWLLKAHTFQINHGSMKSYDPICSEVPSKSISLQVERKQQLGGS